MPRRILIVEDNEGVGALLEDAIRARGLAPLRTGSGTEAIRQINERTPSALVVDLALADLDGFQVANALRARPAGATTPIIVISGVYKKLPDEFAERVRPAFFPKPFDVDVLVDRLASLLALPPSGANEAPVTPAGTPNAGSFVDESPAMLLMRLCEERANGTLDATLGDVRRRLVLQAGYIRYAQSNVLPENAGGRELAAGEITRAQFDGAVQYARQAKVPLPEALRATGVLDAQALARALSEQTRAVSIGFFGMAGGRWTLSHQDPTTAPEGRANPVELIVTQTRAETPPSDARSLLARRAGGRVHRTPLLERESFAVRNAWPGEGVTPLLASTPPLDELVARTKEDDLPLLWALVSSGLVHVEAPVEAVAAPRHENLDAGRTFSPEEQKARAFIASEARRFEGLDHYALLGVTPDTPPDECRRAYLALARRYHSDAYAGLDLGSAAPTLASLFQRVNEAMETLTDTERRTDYNIYLDRKARGLPTDVGAILEAEALFQQGEALFKAGKWPEAYERFEKAVALNHAEPEFHVYLNVCGWKLKTLDATTARAGIQKALETSPRMASGHAFLGMITRDDGDERAATVHLKRALEFDPHFAPALSEMRALNKSKEKPSGSLLKRFFRS